MNGNEGRVIDEKIYKLLEELAKKGIVEIAKERQKLIDKAREGKLDIEEVSNGSITVNNVGVFGVLAILAIINPPEIAIVTAGTIQDKPVVINGEIKIRKIMEMTLSADHRVIDGSYGSRFIIKLKEFLENPKLLMD